MTSPLVGYAWATVVAKDLDRSVAWYREAFGLELLMTNAETCATDAPRFVHLVDPHSLFVIGLQHGSSGDWAAAAGRTKLAQLALNVGAGWLPEHLAHLDSMGVPYQGPLPWSTGRVAHLEDPDGIPLLLYEPAFGGAR